MKYDEYVVLSSEEKIQFLDLLKQYITYKDAYDIDSTITLSDIDIQSYYDKRHEERKNSPVNWPPNLSKKETILCKLALIKFLLEHVNPGTPDAGVMIASAKIFVQTLTSSIIRITPATASKVGYVFQGLEKDVAEILNVIYELIIPYFEKHLKV